MLTNARHGYWAAAATRVASVGALACVLAIGGYDRAPAHSGDSARDQDSSASWPETDGTEPAAPRSAEYLRGQQLYVEFCAACHGYTGRGDGPIARHLEVKPRSFVDEPWRTVESVSPADERTKLEAVVLDGIDGRGMPAFFTKLTDEQCRTIVGYMLVLRNEPEGP